MTIPNLRRRRELGDRLPSASKLQKPINFASGYSSQATGNAKLRVLDERTKQPNLLIASAIRPINGIASAYWSWRRRKFFEKLVLYMRC